MSGLMLDVDQAGELKAAFRRGHWTNADIKRACEGDLLARFHDVVRGFSAITLIPHAIDCSVTPFIPDGWSYREEGQLPNRVCSTWTWDSTKVELFFSRKQKESGYAIGTDLRNALEFRPVLPANILDYLLAHPHLIPEDWKDKTVFFWGTIYHGLDGYSYVRYLRWGGGGWCWHCYCLNAVFGPYSPAAVLVS